MKLRCDGQSPCGSCTKRNLKCNNTVKQTKPKIEGPKAHAATAKIASHLKNDDPESSDRGSIRFLLNGGTDGFTEKFHLPPHSDRTRSMQYHNQKELNETSNLHDNKERLFSDFDDLSSFGESFMSMTTGPFPELQKPLPDNRMDDLAAPALIPPSQDAKTDVIERDGVSSSYGSGNSLSKALIQEILAKAWPVMKDVNAQREISSNLQFLLTPRRIHKFVSLCFQCWNPNINIFHVPSFTYEESPMHLLVSLIFMGAMYSKEEHEASVARRMLDFAELYVFSADLFSADHEVRRMFVSHPVSDEECMDWTQVQIVQGAFAMVAMQYWAGSKSSRNRAMEVRYSEVIRAVRRMGLTRCRHLPEERLNQTAWIRTECRIRLINHIALFDSAHHFYSNFPCRFTTSELLYDLPCEDTIFAAKHPFSHPNFCFSRNLTIYEVFQYLFQDEIATKVCGNAQNEQEERNITIGRSLTTTDMFFLVHTLHSYISSHMVTLAHTMCIKHRDKTTNGTSQRSFVSTSQQQQPSSSFAPADDPVLASIRNALNNWRTLWVDLRARTPTDEWTAMGFTKDAYRFWQVANLLISKKRSIDVITQMEVKCDDKLEKLKVLLQDDND